MLKVVDSALTNFAAATADLDAAVASQLQLLRELAPPHIAAPVEAAILQDAKDILSVVQSLRMINSVPPVTMEVVTGFGEIWSAQTLHAYLQTQGVPTAWLDARQVRARASVAAARLKFKKHPFFFFSKSHLFGKTFSFHGLGVARSQKRCWSSSRTPTTAWAKKARRRRAAWCRCGTKRRPNSPPGGTR